MSESIPVFKMGDRVRVMQTDEMREKGLAGKRGTVLRMYRGKNGYGEDVQLCHVQVDGSSVEAIENTSLDWENR